MTSAKKICVVLVAVCFVTAVALMTACQQKKEAAVDKPEVEKPKNVYEGTVKYALGKYMYIPDARGFDIIAQGFDTSSLVDKEVRVHGEVLLDKPWVFRADSIEVKDRAGSYSSVYTRTAELNLEELIDFQERESIPALKITATSKADAWEGKGRVKVYGKLQNSSIIITDDKGKEVGKIIVNSISDVAKYYVSKLRLFDKFWFYIDVKNTVDAKTRLKTKELFNADVIFTGLF